MKHTPSTRRAVSVLAALAVACAGIFLLTSPSARSASPESALNSAITMSAEPMLGGVFRPGAWAAVRVRVENNGPDVSGELRIATSAQGASTFGIPVQLASGARQEHVLYVQSGAFGGRFEVTLVSGGSAIATKSVAVHAVTDGALGVYVIAEHPEALVTTIRGAVTSPNGPPPEVVQIGVTDLPPRVEAWSSIDRLIWQDVNSTGLTTDQLAAFRTWLSSGGQLVILGGTTGTATLGAFPADLLPYVPMRVIDVPTADLELLLGVLPAGATALPAVAGSLEGGTVLARSGGDVIAARTPYGLGAVALIGIDPSTPWLAGSSAATTFWSSALPPGAARSDPLANRNDDFIVSALNNLPSVQLPRMDQLFLLIVAYIVVIGPLNYLVLRRRDRREWAWLTMPAVIVFFAVAAYGFGVLLKGTSVIVNELAIVHGAAGTDRGVAEVHVGVFSPSRSSFDVTVGGNALVSAQVTNGFGNVDDRPLDVLFGDPSTVRGYSVGYGVLRGFRAEAAVATPRIQADLKLVGTTLQGTITNASDEPIAEVSIVFGDGVQILGDMAPGEARQIELDPADQGSFGPRLVDRLFGAPDSSDPLAARTLLARRAIIQHLSGGWDDGTGTQTGETFANGPVILAWRPGGTLDVDVGSVADHVGETLFVLPARATATGAVVVSGSLIRHRLIDVNALDGSDQSTAFVMGRGTMTVEYRPVSFEGAFAPTGLWIKLASDDARPPTGTGADLAALPAEEQPDPDDPLVSDPRPDLQVSDLPRVQLFDRVAAIWVEFEPLTMSRTYRIADPDRYLDSAGSFRVRFVVRSREAYAYFSLTARLEGNVQ